MNCNGRDIVKSPLTKDALYRQTLEIQSKLNERAPAFHCGFRQAGFTYDSQTASFRRDDVRVYFSQGQPDIQRRLDTLQPYQRFTIKTTRTAAVDVDDALDVPPAWVIGKVLSVVEQVSAAKP